jgi:hypothetical protein
MHSNPRGWCVLELAYLAYRCSSRENPLYAGGYCSMARNVGSMSYLRT